MKKEFRHRLWAWVLLISLAYPITVNFAHSFAEHNLNHVRALIDVTYMPHTSFLKSLNIPEMGRNVVLSLNFEI